MQEALFILSASWEGLQHVFSWPVFPFMMFGVVAGMVLGLIPGLGGLIGLALLIPFVIGLDPIVGLAVLLGMTAVTTQTDTIPAVLLGVPGTSAAMATALDGYPMAKRGEAGRALCASYFASIFGTMVAAVLFVILLPVLRTLVFALGQPEFFMLVMFGLLLAGSLSGRSLLRGLIMAAFGLLLAMVTLETSIGLPRYAGNIIYLWDGIPLVPLVLGLFAIPEVIDLARRGTSISEAADDSRVTGFRQGLVDNLRNWWLIVKASTLGAVAGFIPGLGGQVAEWMAYGAAVASDPDPESFGKGNVRGVIAPEAGTAAQKPGALIPTLAFGIPGNVSMAILLSVFLIFGLVPGPSMVTDDLDITFGMIWMIIVANIAAAALALLFQRWLILLCYIRATIIVPIILGTMLVGATMESRSFGDVIVFAVAGLLGYVFKHTDWPRVPLIMGLIMGGLAERYLFLSYNLHGWGWLTERPLVWLIAGFIFFSVFLPPILKYLRRRPEVASMGDDA
ncbi:tripartite tricarboxylate transporter permease [Frigidibacter sp. ROC022]|uniref:tripartite tricarboxylate transporter permease n=1 Tax=Frigidibacter sp. ROC022 TaxID=2971796 RepID=UPI00215A6FC4|nr:tripartite tricarboxylate transporter permease [Frigidibacter sp. ROC022]MCR8724533.1 tripartite tricarboxylate transporter permease [Frigidibacter sp. ROC022]